MTNSFGEFNRAKMIMVIGSNMTHAHPVASTFVKNAVQNGAKLIVIDPRKHRLVDFADLHLPLNVGSDVALINGLMHVLIRDNLYDADFVKDHCENFDALKEKVEEYTLEKASLISGIAPDLIERTAHMMASVKPAMVCYTLGITEHTSGKNNVMSVANLQMLLGNMGMETGGVNPLRGQNNVQGACDMGALPNVYPGYQKVDDEACRKKFEKAWNTEGMSDKVGLMIPQMMHGLTDGSVRAFYIFGENLANTEPDMHKVAKELEAAEFIVCQDIFQTETTRFADVVLPAAAWSENNGTFTNSERRVNRVRKVSTPPGISKPNWWIFKEIAKRFGHDWPSSSGQQIWDNEISQVAPNLGGVKYSRIENDGLQWPCPAIDHPGTSFLHKDGNFTHGKGIFMALDWEPPAEVPDEEYPLVLSTGRRLYHYHTRTQTGRCEGLNDLLGEETADISIEDAQNLGIDQGEMVRVRSRRGKVNVRARVSDRIPKGLVWMAFHFNEGNANWLTNAAFDPFTLTAEYKACAVSVEKL